MAFKDGDLSNIFNQVAQDKLETQSESESKSKTEKIDPDVPKMIEEHQPIPQPRPKGMGEEQVDREIFNKRWLDEIQKNNQTQDKTDAFDKIDQQSTQVDRNQGPSNKQELE